MDYKELFEKYQALLVENNNLREYVDIHVRMLEKMYSKRLTGYASIGYKAKGESIAKESIDIIFNKSNFLPVYSNDVMNASKEILIVSPFITKKRSLNMMRNLEIALANKVYEAEPYY